MGLSGIRLVMVDLQAELYLGVCLQAVLMQKFSRDEALDILIGCDANAWSSVGDNGRGNHLRD